MTYFSIKTKIIVLTVILSTVTTFFLGSFLIWKSFTALRIQSQQHLLNFAKELASEADEDISQNLEQVHNLSQRPWIVQLDKRIMETELTKVVLYSGATDGFLFLKPDGQVFTKSRIILFHLKVPANQYLKLITKKGPLMKKKPFLEIYETENEDRGILFCNSIYKDGKFEGVLTAMVFLPKHDIGDLQRARIGNSGNAILVNEVGVGVIHPNRADWFKDLSSRPAVAAFKKQGEGIIQYTSATGREILAAFATIPVCSWGVVVRQPAEESYSLAYKMFYFMSFIGVGFILMGVFITSLFSRRLVQPILKLASQLKLYEKGDSDALIENINTKPLDEVGELSQALGQMAKTIQIQISEMKKTHARNLEVEKKLASADRLATIGQFSAGMAHELNNPLATILGSVEMAKTEKGSKQQNWLDEIQREADRCRQLVMDLLNFSKPIKLNVKNFNLVEIIRNSWDQVGPKNDKHVLDISVSEFIVPGDSDRFKQIFINLLKNSIDAMPVGGGVKVTPINDNENFIVEIEDEGTGIIKKNRSKVFTPFFTTKSSGTGLGLSIVQAIVFAHGGNIYFESKKPRGLKIIIKWPRKLKMNKEKT